MERSGVKTYGALVLVAGMAFLTGCDQLQNLLGLGNKKQEVNQQAPVPTPPVPSPSVSSTTQPTQGLLPSNALVRIGNWTLTQEDFNNRLNLLKEQMAGMKQSFKANDPAAKNYVLDQLIRQQLLVKEAEESGVGNSKDIQQAVEDFRRTLLVQDLVNRLTKNVAATESEAKAYYDANKATLTEPVTWQVSQIAVPDETTAKNVLVQILQGGDFAQIAQAQSKASNAAEGGKLKPFITGKAPFAAMQTAIANLGAGDLSGVFKGPEGYYIVKVDSKTGGALKPFPEFKEQIIYFLTQQKQQEALLKRLNELAEKYKPEYNKELIDQVIGVPAHK